MNERRLASIIPSVAASDGAGVKLRRSLGGTERLRHDPQIKIVRQRNEIEREGVFARSGDQRRRGLGEMHP